MTTDSVTRLSVSELLQPNLVAAGTLVDLPLHSLLAQGIRALVLDVDRTLLPHRGSSLPEPMEAWLKRAQETLPLHLFSNNPSRARIGGVAERLGVDFTTSAGKPRRSPLRRVLQQLDLPCCLLLAQIVEDRSRKHLGPLVQHLPESQDSPCPHVIVHGDRSGNVVVYQVSEDQEWILGLGPRDDLSAVASKGRFAGFTGFQSRCYQRG